MSSQTPILPMSCDLAWMLLRGITYKKTTQSPVSCDLAGNIQPGIRKGWFINKHAGDLTSLKLMVETEYWYAA